jgi:hypothetical protein
MAATLVSDRVKDDDIAKWAAGEVAGGGHRFPPLVPGYSDKKPILLLFYRKSKYNPEANGSPEGQRQLRDMAKELGYTVIATGTVPSDWVCDHACDLGEFYTDVPFKGNGREAQISFYYYLMKHFPGGVVQMGQKSGGMDIAALIGMPTLYIEDENSGNNFRMVEWNKHLQLYRPAYIKQPPTVMGKQACYLHEHGESSSKKFSEGYTVEDLATIKSSLQDLVGGPSIKVNLTIILTKDGYIRRKDLPKDTPLTKPQ